MQKPSNPDLVGLTSLLSASPSPFFINPFSLFAHPPPTKPLWLRCILFSHVVGLIESFSLLSFFKCIRVKCTPVLHIRWKQWRHESSIKYSCQFDNCYRMESWSWGCIYILFLSFFSYLYCLVVYFFVFDINSFSTRTYIFVFSVFFPPFH